MHFASPPGCKPSPSHVAHQGRKESRMEFVHKGKQAKAKQESSPTAILYEEREREKRTFQHSILLGSLLLLLLGSLLFQLLLKRLPSHREHHGLTDVDKEAGCEAATQEAADAIRGKDIPERLDIPEVRIRRCLLDLRARRMQRLMQSMHPSTPQGEERERERSLPS